MSDTDPELNPYAPAEMVDESDGFESAPFEPDVSDWAVLRKTAVRWFLVCGISAIPSFVFGLIATSGQFLGMLTGIAIFAVGYTGLDFATRKHALRRKKIIRRTLRITYGTRIGMSVLFPVGAYVDVICGIVTLSVIGFGGVSRGLDTVDSGEGMPYFAAVITTIAQGFVLNLVLAVYAALVLFIQWMVEVLKR